MQNLETVQQMYAAFGRGDIPAILAHLSDDVEWEYGAGPTDVPWLQPRKGKQEVTEFFGTLAAIEFNRFEPKELLGGENKVVALIDAAFTVKATGRRIEDETEVHIWHFNDEGLVNRFAHRLDTHKHVMAHAEARVEEQAV